MSKQAELIKSLVKRTAAGRANWKQTAEENDFLLSFSQYSVRLSEEPSTMPDGASEDQPDYVLRIFNNEGILVEEVRDWNQSLQNQFGPEVYAFNVMRDLYQDARRQAIGLDDAYNYLLKELDSDLPF